MNAALIEGVLAVEEQLPEDVGKSGPLGLFLLLLLLVAGRGQHRAGHQGRHRGRRHRTPTSLRIPANRSSSGTGASTTDRASS